MPNSNETDLPTFESKAERFGPEIAARNGITRSELAHSQGTRRVRLEE